MCAVSCLSSINRLWAQKTSFRLLFDNQRFRQHDYVHSFQDASHIARFDGTDFSNWKFEISFVLEQHRLLIIVNGTELLPAPVIPDTTTGVVTNQAAINSWTERDVSARSCIYSSVEHSTRKALVQHQLLFGQNFILNISKMQQRPCTL